MLQRGELLVDDLIGNRRVVRPGESLTIGRLSDFVVGAEDTSLHRNFLQVWSNGSQWYIKNIGSFVSASIQPRADKAYTAEKLPAGGRKILQPGVSSIYFSTPQMDYEIEVTVAEGVKEPEYSFPPDGTFTANTFEPNAEQRELLRRLAQPLLDHPYKEPRIAVKPHEELAADLGWSSKKLERKIQYIADTLARLGVPEFQPGTKVTWRIVLAEYAAQNPHLFK